MSARATAEISRTEKAIGIAERLYEARGTARWLLGERYAVQLRTPMNVLRELAEREGGVIGALHFVLVDLRRDIADGAGLGLLLMAAAAELIEPDAKTPAEVQA